MDEIEWLKKLRIPIVTWYQENKRDLPWRIDKNPYTTWISEIMLQQTRIEAVKQYYERFLKELPTISDLAKVEDEKLLKLWEGLGYYNRARNLKKAAQIMVEQYDGMMPNSYQELIKLPGIGEYTAGAISSICYQEKVPAVDGNVLRVVSRFIASRKDILNAKIKKEFSDELLKIMPDQAGDFNEGLMELGEVICLPTGEPLCHKCPLQKDCLAKKEKLVTQIPVRIKKIKRKQVDKTIFVLECNQKIAISKRKETGLLAGMYEFPNVDDKIDQEGADNFLKSWNLVGKKIIKMESYHHIFSHVEWDMIGYQVRVEKENEEFLWVPKEELLQKYPIPGAFFPFRDQIMKV